MLGYTMVYAACNVQWRMLFRPCVDAGLAAVNCNGTSQGTWTAWIASFTEPYLCCLKKVGVICLIEAVTNIKESIKLRGLYHEFIVRRNGASHQEKPA